jgi:hypothetical protein
VAPIVSQADAFAPGGGDGNGELGHLCLHSVEPARFRPPLLDEPVPFPHRPLIGVNALAVSRIDRKDKAIEESSTVGGGAGKERIH